MRNLTQLRPVNKQLSLTDARRLFGASIDAPLPARRATPPLPELVVIAALVEDAINILIGGRAKPALIWKTLWWVRTGDRGSVTFDETCLWLGLNPEVTRRALLAPGGMPGRNGHEIQSRKHARSRTGSGTERKEKKVRNYETQQRST
jgi:hypothetical protein